ncbi:MAG: dTMP kinase [Gammaproteobacteria bacterium]
MMTGKFITIEGIEGVGKSTNMAFLRDHLTAQGQTVCVTREPGGTELAEAIRQVILQQHDEPLSDSAELLLIFAARAVHLDNLVRPALARNEWVVCDRFTDATYAYQGAGRGLPSGDIDTMRDLVQGDLRPDLTLLLDAPLKTSRGRAQERNNQKTGSVDRFEGEEQAFFERVRRAYLDIAAAEPDRIVVINADRPLVDVQESLAHALDRLLID